MAGLKYPRPSTSRLNDEIDKGGNGKVYNYLSQSCELAVKLVGNCVHTLVFSMSVTPSNCLLSQSREVV